MPLFDDLFTATFTSLKALLLGMAIPTVFFVVLALLMKKQQAFADFRQKLPNILTNIQLLLFNTVFILPLLLLLAEQMQQHIGALLSAQFWAELPVPLVVFIAIFLGDFIGYWRHRLEHCRWLWPAHAVHHSDTHMTWLTLERFHPINRVSTFLIDNSFLLLVGLPPYALVVNNLVRHYYGFFIHADLPWDYGRWNKIFVSPQMHRWHHVVDVKAHNTNYATVFSLFDRWFGTYYLPGRCDADLGVIDKTMRAGFWQQMLYPLRRRMYKL